MNVSRRKFLAGLFLVPLAGAGLYLGRQQFISNKKISNIFGEDSYDLEVGKAAYQAFFKGEGLEDLIGKLKLRFPGYYKIFPSLALRRAMRDDYWNGETLIFRGWVLAKSLLLLNSIAYLENRHVR